jgi:hypothetical protein
MRRARDTVQMKQVKKSTNILVGTPEWKRPLRRPRHRWEHNIKMKLIGKV